jgi:hypothetical protein
MEGGLIEQAGAMAGDGCTEQERAIEPPNPETAVMLTVAMDDPPGLTEAGIRVEADREKFGAAAPISNTVPKLPLPPAAVVP